MITITVGGNDLLRIMEGADPAAVLQEFQNNLVQIFLALKSAPELQNTRIYISNLYSIPEIPASEYVVPVFNQIVAGVAANFGVTVADVYSTFKGKSGLLLVERHGAAMVRGLQSAGAAATVKHFPGLGAAGLSRM